FVSVYPPAHDAYFSEKSLVGLLTAIVLPGRFFTESFEPLTVILGYKLTWVVGTALLAAVVAGLATSPTLAIAAAGATWGFSLLFALIYGGLYRHQALLIVFFVCLYWIASTRCAQGGPGGKEAFKLGLGIALPLLLLTQDISAANRAVKEITLLYSSSKSLSILLNNTPELKNAIVMGSPDYLVEALPYYAPNDLYLTRENRFGRVPLYSKKFATQMRLPILLDPAQRLRAEYRRLIVILVGRELNEDFPETTLSEGGGRTFHYTQEEAHEFKAAVEKLASLRGTIEVSKGYDVYILR